MQPKLRTYQERAVMEASAALADSRSVLFVCPTGGGKTFVFAELAWMFRQNHGRVLVLADREHLVGQAADVIRERTGLSVGPEQGKEHVDPQHLPDVVCATIQSMRRPGKLATFDAASFALIVIDEADLGVAPSYAAVLSHFASARVFGCTATPDRADGKSLGAVFEKVITPLYMGDLITQGYLSPIRRTLVRIQSVTLDNVKTVDGDYSNADLERVLTHEKALHEVVRPSMDLSGTRPSIVFAATVAHAEALADVFNRYAPKSASVIHGKMPVKERRKLLKEYERGKIRFLCSCAMLLRGVDLPLTSCVIMARPTQSRALYCQAIGRGTRLAKGKNDLLVLDFTDNSTNHALISAIDLMRTLPADVRERAREIADAQPGADPIAVIEQAELELAADPEVRAAILARVEYQTRPLDLRKWINWDEQPLGQMPDAELAKRLNVTAPAVSKARRDRGIAGGHKHGTKVTWTKELFDNATNTELAKRFGICKSTVSAARKRLGLPRALAEFIDWDNQPLGVVSDAKLAKTLGVDSSVVGAARVRRGIEPVNPWARNKKAKPLVKRSAKS
jgi:superfamily II DNA or RNA helicase